MKYYKLTTQKRTTHNGFQVPEPGIWFEAEDMECPPMPCTNTVLHFYHHPLLAVLFNPVHANVKNPRLWEIKIDAEAGTDGMKGWCRRQKLVRELPLPEITIDQRVAFAIYCAEPFCTNKAWLEWATNWMIGKDRSENLAWARAARAARAAEAAARAAEWAAKAARKVAAEKSAAMVVLAAAMAAENAAMAAENAALAAEEVTWAARTREDAEMANIGDLTVFFINNAKRVTNFSEY